MVRGDEVRGWRLSDMLVYNFDISLVGPSPFKLLGFLMLESKCNQVCAWGGVGWGGVWGVCGGG